MIVGRRRSNNCLVYPFPHSVCLSVCALRGRQAPVVLAPFLQFIYPKLLRLCRSPLPLGQVSFRLPPCILSRT